MMNHVQSIADERCESRVSDENRDALVAKYSMGGPRYTSYPTAAHFSTDVDQRFYRDHVQMQSSESIAPLSLYIHIPFCQNICYYCACNKVVTSDHGVADRYLRYLGKEISMQSQLLGRHRPIMQLHFGGGTPTFLDGAQITKLMHQLASHFCLTDAHSREYSIEIDPRTITADSLALLKGLGFNRISLGVQDFDKDVQKAINRIQSVSMVKALTEAARLYQFKSVSYDLIYGLPKQTLDSLGETLDQVIELSPDRIAFYNYAHLPERFSSQRAIDRQGLPSVQEKIRMLTLITGKLVSEGYIHIGMDHFVKPQDELAIAQSEGMLQRNFQGYSICKASDLVGLGVSAISSMEGSYLQNDRTLEPYYQRLDNNDLAINRGYVLSDDDKLRRAVIMQIICKLEVDVQQIEQEYSIDFPEYFSSEIDTLRTMEAEGLIFWRNDKLRITEHGRVVLRNICMVFDAYIEQKNASDEPIRYSNVL
jgi:oxygen-independent coproporphyrinogen III oxidase